MRKPIGYHFTGLTADMAVSGTLWPNVVRVVSEAAALEMARAEVEGGADPLEASLGCLTVYDDGSVSHAEFGLDELDGEDGEE